MRSARKGRNPATGKEIDIPETKARGRFSRCNAPGRVDALTCRHSPQAPAFSAGKSFKDHVKGV